MGRPISGVICVLLVALVVTGCRSDLEYHPPLASEPSATVIGSKSGDSTAYVMWMDGKLISTHSWSWDDKTVIAPGMHRLWVDAGDSQHEVSYQFDMMFKAGEAYTLKTAPPPDAKARCIQVAIWVEDSKGNLASERFLVEPLWVSGGHEIPLVGGGFISSPSVSQPPKCPAK